LEKITLQALPWLVLAAHAGALLAQHRHQGRELTDEEKTELLDLIETDFVFAARYYLRKKAAPAEGERVQ
jgi:hypothetical protein